MFSVLMIPVFAYCIWVGKIFAKRCKGHWSTFLFFPVVFTVTAFLSLSVHSSPLHWFAYLLCLWGGCLFGLLITNPVFVKVDLVRQTVSAPGSWLLFFCLMVLCIAKCVFDWFYVLMPDYILQLKLINFSLKGVVTGLLYGQALSFWYRFSIADTCAPDELVRGRFVRFYGLSRVSPTVEAASGPLLVTA